MNNASSICYVISVNRISLVLYSICVIFFINLSFNSLSLSFQNSTLSSLLPHSVSTPDVTKIVNIKNKFHGIK